MCDGGELFDRIIEKGKFSEKEAHNTFFQIMQALNYCHMNKICHRDLKPENFLFLTKSDTSPIKIIDFGLSKIFASDSGEKIDLNTRAGTVNFNYLINNCLIFNFIYCFFILLFNFVNTYLYIFLIIFIAFFLIYFLL